MSDQVPVVPTLESIGKGQIAWYNALERMGELRIIFTVFWPLAGPPLAMVGLFVFMGSWNEVL